MITAVSGGHGAKVQSWTPRGKYVFVSASVCECSGIYLDASTPTSPKTVLSALSTGLCVCVGV